MTLRIYFTHATVHYGIATPSFAAALRMRLLILARIYRRSLHSGVRFIDLKMSNLEGQRKQKDDCILVN